MHGSDDADGSAAIFLKKSGIDYIVENTTIRLWPREKPNIVFIFLDDLGWKDVGYMGSEYYETPHIDRLAGQGMIFTHAYTNAANCAPTRASLLSGQYTPRHGVFTVARSDRGKSENRRLVPVTNSRTMSLDRITIAEEKDLSNKDIDKRNELLKDLLEWQHDAHAPVPLEPNPECKLKS
ncbi:MAG: sulfatase-like hydrolase/transferase [Bacteroidetes bacterium]|nr:sulfatase-like hydrolase/transferase [Bacteroidota bacterium]